MGYARECAARAVGGVAGREPVIALEGRETVLVREVAVGDMGARTEEHASGVEAGRQLIGHGLAMIALSNAALRTLSAPLVTTVVSVPLADLQVLHAMLNQPLDAVMRKALQGKLAILMGAA